MLNFLLDTKQVDSYMSEIYNTTGISLQRWWYNKNDFQEVYSSDFDKHNDQYMQ